MLARSYQFKKKITRISIILVGCFASVAYGKSFFVNLSMSLPEGFQRTKIDAALEIIDKNSYIRLSNQMQIDKQSDGVYLVTIQDEQSEIATIKVNYVLLTDDPSIIAHKGFAIIENFNFNTDFTVKFKIEKVQVGSVSAGIVTVNDVQETQVSDLAIGYQGVSSWGEIVLLPNLP